MLCLKFAGCVSNSVDPDETLRSAASYLGLNCLLRVVCPNTYGKYGRLKCKNIRFIYLIFEPVRGKRDLMTVLFV